MNDMNEQKSFCQRKEGLAVMLIIALVVLWLGVSWLNGGFPFSSQSVPSSEKLEQQALLDSLTPPAGAVSTPLSAELLKTLTAPPQSKTKGKTSATSSAALLESLTPPKK